MVRQLLHKQHGNTTNRLHAVCMGDCFLQKKSEHRPTRAYVLLDDPTSENFLPLLTQAVSDAIIGRAGRRVDIVVASFPRLT